MSFNSSISLESVKTEAAANRGLAVDATGGDAMRTNQATLRSKGLLSSREITRSGHVVAILPRGEAIRNFVYSGALEFARERGARVTVIAVRPSMPVWEQLEDRFGRDSVHELLLLKACYPVRLLRDILDLCHGRNLWSAASQERWRLRDREAQGGMAKSKRIIKKALARPLATQWGVQFLEHAERVASRMLRTSEHYLDLYREWQPTLVFNGSHVHSQHAIPAVEAAQWLGIPTASFIFSWDNLTSQGRVMPPYDYHLVWNKALRDQLLEIYPRVTPDRVFVTGTPQFDCHFLPEFQWDRQTCFERIGASPKRPLVLYATGMANHMPGEERIVEQVADLLGEMKDVGRPQLLVRVYAKDRTGRFDTLRQRRPDILFQYPFWDATWLTPRIEDAYLYGNTLRHCDLGINVASTVALELCMFDKPVVNVGYNPPGVSPEEVSYAHYYNFDHYRPVVESGAVQVARSPLELRQMIQDGLKHREARQQQRAALVNHFFGNTLDGRSGQRVARVLVGLATGGDGNSY
jgi:hypothetical protein